jgi:hypothetical protein
MYTKTNKARVTLKILFEKYMYSKLEYGNFIFFIFQKFGHLYLQLPGCYWEMWNSYCFYFQN